MEESIIIKPTTNGKIYGLHPDDMHVDEAVEFIRTPIAKIQMIKENMPLSPVRAKRPIEQTRPSECLPKHAVRYSSKGIVQTQDNGIKMQMPVFTNLNMKLVYEVYQDKNAKFFSLMKPLVDVEFQNTFELLSALLENSGSDQRIVVENCLQQICEPWSSMQMGTIKETAYRLFCGARITESVKLLTKACSVHFCCLLASFSADLEGMEMLLKTKNDVIEENKVLIELIVEIYNIFAKQSIEVNAIAKLPHDIVMLLGIWVTNTQITEIVEKFLDIEPKLKGQKSKHLNVFKMFISDCEENVLEVLEEMSLVTQFLFVLGIYRSRESKASIRDKCMQIIARVCLLLEQSNMFEYSCFALSLCWETTLLEETIRRNVSLSSLISEQEQFLITNGYTTMEKLYSAKYEQLSYARNSKTRKIQDKPFCISDQDYLEQMLRCSVFSQNSKQSLGILHDLLPLLMVTDQKEKAKECIMLIPSEELDAITICALDFCSGLQVGSRLNSLEPKSLEQRAVVRLMK